MSTVMKAFKKAKPEKIENPPFSNFTIKVDVNKSYHGTVKKLLGSVEGVIAFKMKDSGTVIVSGYIDPDRLMSCLKKAGNNVEMVDWQYGECSNNLIVKEPPKKEKEKEKEKENKNEKGIEANYFYPGFYDANERGNGYDYGYGNGHENGHWHGNGYGNGYGYGNGHGNLQRDGNGYGNGNGYGYWNGYWHGNGHGNGYGYGNGYRDGYDYNLGFPITERSFAHKHIECSGDAEGCDGHHNIPKEIPGSEEDLIPIPGENNPKCCNIM